jgi:hypothetical protein
MVNFKFKMNEKVLFNNQVYLVSGFDEDCILISQFGGGQAISVTEDMIRHVIDEGTHEYNKNRKLNG